MWLPARFRPDRSECVTSLTLSGDSRRGLAPGVLALTADDRLYYLLLSASIDLGWRIRWARTVRRAFELCCASPTPLVVCDERLPGLDWREALPDLAKLPDHPAVLLAMSEVNENVWEEVLRGRGYDAVCRAASTQEWKRELRFAWLSAQAPGPQRYSTGRHDGSGSKRDTGTAPPFAGGAMSF